MVVVTRMHLFSIIFQGIIAVTVPQLLKAKKVIAVVAGKDYATVCKNATEGKPGPANLPAFLQNHPDACLYMDKEASHLLKVSVMWCVSGPSLLLSLPLPQGTTTSWSSCDAIWR